MIIVRIDLGSEKPVAAMDDEPALQFLDAGARFSSFGGHGVELIAFLEPEVAYITNVGPSFGEEGNGR